VLHEGQLVHVRDGLTGRYMGVGIIVEKVIKSSVYFVLVNGVFEAYSHTELNPVSKNSGSKKS